VFEFYLYLTDSFLGASFLLMCSVLGGKRLIMHQMSFLYYGIFVDLPLNFSKPRVDLVALAVYFL
jgi:hypothetical protein